MRPTAASLRLLGLLALGAPAALAANPGDSSKFTLDHVYFKGNSRVTTDTLMGVVQMQPGQKVDRDAIVNDFNNVIAEYKKEDVGGSINPTMTYPRPGHINVTFEVTEAAPEVAKVVEPVLDHETFTGNQKVGNAQLTPALTMKPGQDVTKDLVVADMTALSKVYKGANKSVMITPKVTNTTTGHIDLNFEINENPPKQK